MKHKKIIQSKIIFYTILLNGKFASYNTDNCQRLNLNVQNRKQFTDYSVFCLQAVFIFFKEKVNTISPLNVNMITDGFGNLIAGGNNGGKSSINYKPYGEINRTDSS